MVRRTNLGRFGGVFVFPGGKVDEVDRGELAANAVEGVSDPIELGWRAAGYRELAEEVGLYATEPAVPQPPRPHRGEGVYRYVSSARAVFSAHRLVYIANWVTPREAPVRFNTRFFALVIEDDSFVPRPAAEEITEAEWIEPREALIRWESGEWRLVLPTIKNLEFLAACSTPAEVVAGAPRPGEISPVEPQLVVEDGVVVARLPGERGYTRDGLR